MSRGSFRHTMQTFNHTIWAAKNASKLVKSGIGAARSVSRKMRDTRRRLLNGPKSNVVARVQKRTRGSIDPKYFNKATPAGAKRRADLAAKLKKQRGAIGARRPYSGKIVLEKGMTNTELKRRVNRHAIKKFTASEVHAAGSRKAAADSIRKMRQQASTTTSYPHGDLTRGKANRQSITRGVIRESRDSLYKKAVNQYHKNFPKK